MIGAYVYRVNTPGGVVAYLNDLATWHHVFKDALFCTQELFGDLIAVRSPPSLRGPLDLHHLTLVLTYRCIVVGSSGIATGWL